MIACGSDDELGRSADGSPSPPGSRDAGRNQFLERTAIPIEQAERTASVVNKADTPFGQPQGTCPMR